MSDFPCTYYDTSHKQRLEWKFANDRNGESLFKMTLIEKVNRFNKTAFEKAYEAVVRRHESFRINFVIVNGKLKYKINEYDAGRYKIHGFDLRNEKDPGGSADRLIKIEKERGVDLFADPLINVQLYHVDSGNYVIAIFVEHIISDVYSKEILKRELFRFYEAYVTSNTFFSSSIASRFTDYTDWRNKQVKNIANRQYWKEKENAEDYRINFAGFYKDALFKKQIFRGVYIFYIEKLLKDAMGVLAIRFKITLFGLFISTFIIFLSRIYNQQHILIATLFIGRTNVTFHDLIANCTEFFFLFNSIGEDASVEETVREIYSNYIKSTEFPYAWQSHGRWPFRDQTLFTVNYMSEGLTSKKTITQFDASHSKYRSRKCRMKPCSDLTINEYLNGLQFTCRYSHCYFAPPMIEYLFNEYLSTLKNIIAHPEIKISALKNYK